MLNIPETLAALGFFGLVAVFPITMVLLRHQRAMAEMIHKNSSDINQQRIEMLENEVRALKAARYEELIRQDDERELGKRIGGG